jgi:hypothetical protein
MNGLSFLFSDRTNFFWMTPVNGVDLTPGVLLCSLRYALSVLIGMWPYFPYSRFLLYLFKTGQAQGFSTEPPCSRFHGHLPAGFTLQAL